MTFNYKKEFFHRPFFTELNVMFLWFLLLSMVLVVPFTVLSYRLVSKIPEGKLRSGLTGKRLVQLLNYPAPAAKNETENHLEIADVKFAGGKFYFPGELRKSVTVSAGKRGSAPLHGSSDGVVKVVLATASGSEKRVAAAIAGVAFRVEKSVPTDKSPLKPLRDRQNEYDNNIKNFKAEKTSKVAINNPAFTDFDIVKGYRNSEETISLANENARFVKLCLKKFSQKYASGGKVEVKYSIHPDGHIIPGSIRIINTNIDDPRIINCIKKNIRRFQNFPAVAIELGEYSITQKYVF